MIQHVCDRCGKVIRNGINTINFYKTYERTYHLCGDCAKELYEWLGVDKNDEC